MRIVVSTKTDLLVTLTPRHPATAVEVFGDLDSLDVLQFDEAWRPLLKVKGAIAPLGRDAASELALECYRAKARLSGGRTVPRARRVGGGASGSPRARV